MTTSLRFISLTPLITPTAEPSLVPKMPFRFGLACRMDLVISVDLRWSPPPYWMLTILMPGKLVLLGDVGVAPPAVLDADDLDARVAGLDALDEAVTAVYAGAIGLVMHDQRDLAALADQ